MGWKPGTSRENHLFEDVRSRSSRFLVWGLVHAQQFVAGREPSPEAALFDTPGCDLADISKTAMKVTRRRILALTRKV